MSKETEKNIKEKNESKSENSIGLNEVAKQDEVPVKDLFELGIKKSKEIKSTSQELDKLYKKKEELENEKKRIKKILSPIPRSVNKIHVLSRRNKPTRRERKQLKVTIEDINNQLILLNDQIEDLEMKLGSYVGKSVIDLKRQQLVNKSYSKAYTKKNIYFIKAKLLKVINQLSAEKDITVKTEIISKAQVDTDEGKKEFKETFGNFMDKIDSSAYIMCSGTLSKFLYESARLTILNADPDSTLEIKELTLPSNEKKENDK